MEIKIKIGKKGIVTSLILLLVLAAYNVYFFVIPFNKDLSAVSYWITYGITVFLILFMGVVVFIGFHDKKIKSRVFGIPVVYLGFLSICAQFLIDAIVMIVGNWLEFYSWITIVIETLLLTFFFISLIVRTAYKDTVRKIDASASKETFLKELRIQVATIAESIDGDSLKREANELLELITYSDPVSSPCVSKIEDSILLELEKTKNAIASEDVDFIKSSIAKIKSLMMERNIRLKAER